MLLVETRVDKSGIHGLGLFACQAIPQGTVIWRFTPGFDLDLDPRLLDELQTSLRDRLLHYGWVDVRTGRFILCCDDARFINHSDHPNTRSVYDRKRHGVDIAVRDIAPGEEITTDYVSIEGRRPDPGASGG